MVICLFIIAKEFLKLRKEKVSEERPAPKDKFREVKEKLNKYGIQVSYR